MECFYQNRWEKKQKSINDMKIRMRAYVLPNSLCQPLFTSCQQQQRYNQLMQRASHAAKILIWCNQCRSFCLRTNSTLIQHWKRCVLTLARCYPSPYHSRVGKIDFIYGLLLALAFGIDVPSTTPTLCCMLTTRTIYNSKYGFLSFCTMKTRKSELNCC